MIHRNLNPGYDDSVEAVQDILERGSEEDWRELALRVLRDPAGPTAQSLKVVLAAVPMYGTTKLWRLMLVDLGLGHLVVSP